MPTVDDTAGLSSAQPVKPKENKTQTEKEIITSTPEQLILTEQKITKFESKYNKDKYKQIDRTTAQVEPDEVVKNTYLSHPNLESLITQENEDDIEIVLEEPLMQSHSCLGKSYKKKDLIRVMDALIKNVSISVIDNVLFNSIEKLYRINKDFVRLSDAPTSEITKDDF
ncbi:MAG: hypothetical protein EZS28_008163 [Streblomastix strix]|uniref:Uncharacterized protein n=1 Tax=Streblomastix strix TaxID=222440 RepID=A0A5J4WMK2_9EUKA|nr:MAG: hypothetical protein EZS28_008163 [Streblomastix strix]